MRPTELANKNGLAGSGGKEVKQPYLGRFQLMAGFELTINGRF
jgi:hypothetical protein